MANNSPLIQVFAPTGVEPGRILPASGVGNAVGDSAFLQVSVGALNSLAQPVSLRGFSTDADNIATISNQDALATLAFLAGFDGALFDRLRTGSATNLALLTGQGALMMARPGEWAIQHQPAAATQATVTRAAGGAGVRHVCRSITVSILAVAAQGQIIVNLRDGATGAGTILWSAGFVLAAGTSDRLALTDLNILGSANTAMTLEVAAAPAATNFAQVALTGFDVS